MQNNFIQNLKFVFSHSSTFTLILANLIPFFGVLFWHWDLRTILFLYWSESGVIGFFNVLKMSLAQGVESKQASMSKIGSIIFFILHFGTFMAVHGIFLFIITGSVATFSSFSWSSVLFGLAGIFSSHGYSFVSNYLINKEYQTATVSGLFSHPYSRIIVMHFTILLGGFISMILGSPAGLLILLIIFKIIVDLSGHLHERIKFTPVIEKDGRRLTAQFEIDMAQSPVATKGKKFVWKFVGAAVLIFVVGSFVFSATRFLQISKLFSGDYLFFPDSADQTQQEQPNQEWQEYTNPNGGYQFSYPQSWLLESEDFKDDFGKVLYTEAWLKESADGQLEDRLRINYAKDLQCSITSKHSAELQLSQKYESAAGMPATIFEGEDSLYTGDRHLKIILIPHNEMCYEFYLWDKKGNPNEAIFDQIIKSFKIGID